MEEEGQQPAAHLQEQSNDPSLNFLGLRRDVVDNAQRNQKDLR